MAKKYYVVWEGRHPGIYDDWEDAREQIEGFPGARYKAFPNSAAAAAAFRSEISRQDTQDLKNLLGGIKGRVPEDYLRFSEIDPKGWAVDASCLGNPGKMEYRCVELSTGREIFRQGPFPKGTNNIGEFLAIVHALALMEKTNDWHTLYSDSRTAIGWVSRRQPKTTLVRDEQTEFLYELLGRGMIWIRTHNWPVKVLKWDTDRWGEIPADFDRK